MAARKDPVETPDVTPYDLGLGSEDVQLPRLRVVGRQAKLADAEVCPHAESTEDEPRACAKPGDVAIGAGAEDVESQIIHALNGKEPVRFYVLKIHSNYACSFNGPQGQWEEGDPEMPPEAKRQYNYTMYVPQHSDILPVVYTAGSTAAREGRKVNTKLATEAIGGKAPFETCFTMTTKINTAGTNSWPGPVFALAEPVEAEVAKAKQMHDDMGLGVKRTALSSGDDSTTPSF